jgi:hypothetical protein
VAVSACGGERQNPADRALGADAPPGLALLLKSPFRAVGDARGARFSGRVPTLSPREQPRDTLRMGRSFGDSTSFALINAMEVVGSRLVVADQQMSKHIAVIDRESGRIEAWAGGHGKGPREFLNPNWFRVESVSPARVWAYDFQNRRETLLRLDEPEGSMVGGVRRLEAGQALERPIRAGNRILSSGLFVDYTLLQMDTLGKPLARLVSDPPFKERHMPVRAGRRILNRGFLDADPAGRRLAMAYQWTSRIDFFTADGTRLGSVQGPRPTTPRYRHRDNLFFYDDAAEMAYVSLHRPVRVRPVLRDRRKAGRPAAGQPGARVPLERRLRGGAAAGPAGGGVHGERRRPHALREHPGPVPRGGRMAAPGGAGGGRVQRGRAGGRTVTKASPAPPVRRARGIGRAGQRAAGAAAKSTSHSRRFPCSLARPSRTA